MKKEELEKKYHEFCNHKKKYAKSINDLKQKINLKIKNIINNDENLKEIKTKIVGSVGNGTVVVNSNNLFDIDITLIKKVTIDDLKNDKQLIKDGRFILNRMANHSGELYNSHHKRTIELQINNQSFDIKVDLGIVFTVDNKKMFNAKYFNNNENITSLKSFNKNDTYNEAKNELLRNIKSKKIIARYNQTIRFAKYLKYFHQLNFSKEKNELYTKVKDIFLSLPNKNLNRKENAISILEKI